MLHTNRDRDVLEWDVHVRQVHRWFHHLLEWGIQSCALCVSSTKASLLARGPLLACRLDPSDLGTFSIRGCVRRAQTGGCVRQWSLPKHGHAPPEQCRTVAALAPPGPWRNYFVYYLHHCSRLHRYLYGVRGCWRCRQALRVLGDATQPKERRPCSRTAWLRDDMVVSRGVK